MFQNKTTHADIEIGIDFAKLWAKNVKQRLAISM